MATWYSWTWEVIFYTTYIILYFYVRAQQLIWPWANFFFELKQKISFQKTFLQTHHCCHSTNLVIVKLLSLIGDLWHRQMLLDKGHWIIPIYHMNSPNFQSTFYDYLWQLKTPQDFQIMGVKQKSVTQIWFDGPDVSNWCHCGKSETDSAIQKWQDFSICLHCRVVEVDVSETLAGKWAAPWRGIFFFIIIILFLMREISAGNFLSSNPAPAAPPPSPSVTVEGEEAHLVGLNSRLAH